MKLLSFRGLLPLLTLAATITNVNVSRAADLYWGTWDGVVTNPTWAGGSWYSDAGETTLAAVPTLSDDVYFNTTPDNALGGTISITGNINANALIFNTSAGTLLSQNNNRTLNLGTGGFVMNSTSGNVTLGQSTNSLSVEMTGNQTWTNSSSAAMASRTARPSNSLSGDMVLTFNMAGSGSFTTALGFRDSPDGLKKLAVVVDSTGTGTVGMTVASGLPYSGGTTIRRGIFSTTSNAGGGAVVLDNTGGVGNATWRLSGGGTTTTTSALTVASTSVGNSVLEFSAGSSATPTFSGTLVLNNNLSVGINTSNTVTLSSGISGSGNLTKTVYQNSPNSGALVISGAASHSGNTVINSGAFTLLDTGALTFYIGANGINNQLLGTSAGAVNLNGAFNLDLTNAVLTNGASWQLVSLTANEVYGGTFALNGFTENANVWTNGAGLTYTESTGLLNYSIPEPSTIGALVLGLGGLCLLTRRRR